MGITFSQCAEGCPFSLRDWLPRCLLITGTPCLLYKEIIRGAGNTVRLRDSEIISARIMSRGWGKWQYPVRTRHKHSIYGYPRRQLLSLSISYVPHSIIGSSGVHSIYHNISQYCAILCNNPLHWQIGKKLRTFRLQTTHLRLSIILYACDYARTVSFGKKKLPVL